LVSIQYSPVSAATNKEVLLQNISALETNLNSLRTSKHQDIDTKLQSLAKQYDDVVISL